MRYPYESTDGSIRAMREYPMGKAPQTITVKGVTLWKQFSLPSVRVKGPSPKTGPESGYWQVSRANGCHPDQVQDMHKLDAQVGAPAIDYVPTEHGMRAAAFKSKREKNNWLKAHKRVDLDACYDAPAPGDFKDKVDAE